MFERTTVPNEYVPSTTSSDKKKKKKRKPPLWTRGWFIVLASLFLIAVLSIACVFAYPKQTLGSVAKFLASGPAPNTAEILDGHMPGTSVMRDKDGNVITFFYDQRRQPVKSQDISPTMKDAIVAIEDRRFYEHDGVDWKGVVRAVITNATTDDVQGASTLTQQYIKNYTWLITAHGQEDQDQAIEQSYTRKIAEIATAEDITEQLSKDEILTRYLNLVSFGHNSYGIQDAARTYFGVSAKDLTPPQAAMLAGMVQAPSMFDPYTDYAGVKDRRNVVLDAMTAEGYLDAREAEGYKAEELGTLDAPRGLPSGCASAENRGFFCDKVLEDLAAKDISVEDLKAGGYDITTTLDPGAQDAATAAAKKHNPDPAQPIGEAVVFVQPGETSRPVRAIASSRDYGYEPGQTSLPVATTSVGHGAGSVFKIFAAAVALEKGYDLNQTLSVPANYEASGLGEGGNEGCPPGKYCVTNAGTYSPTMSFTTALALSPNTPFIEMAEKVGNANIVNKAVSMGLRSYGVKNDDGVSVADTMRGSGSFVLGPTAVNTLELSNVGATIASGGVWCEPQTINKVLHNDQDTQIPAPSCERALEKDVAAKLSNALSKDTTEGTASASAKATGWGDKPMSAKTGTTDDNQSASFLGFTQGLSGAVYIFNDSDNPMPLCSGPLTQCSDGNLFGGLEPARTWFDTATPIIDAYGGPSLPPVPGRNSPPASAPQAPVQQPESKSKAEELAIGRSEGQATANLSAAGYMVTGKTYVDNREYGRGQVVGITNNGGRITLQITTTGKETASALGGGGSAGDLSFDRSTR